MDMAATSPPKSLLLSLPAEVEKKIIDEELKKNGYAVNMDEDGYSLLKFIGFEMAISGQVARGEFTVTEKSCQPFGVLHGGVTAFIAESIASAAAGSSSRQRVAGVELNVNHLRAAILGTKVIVTAKPLMKGNRIEVWEVKFEIPNPDKSGSDSSELVLSAVARLTLRIGLPLPESHKKLLLKAYSKL